MARVIGLVSLKGGVGKTTISAALASDLARYGKKVLLVDANYSAPNLGLHMDIFSQDKTIHDVLTGKNVKSSMHKKHYVDVIPGNFFYKRGVNPLKLKNKLGTIKDQYDYIVLDSSPGLNDELVSTILSSDDLFIVSTPDCPSLSCTMKTVKIAKQMNKEVRGVIVNRIRKTPYELSLEEIQETSGVPVVLQAREDKAVHKSLFYRKPATVFDSKSAFSKQVRNLTRAVMGLPEKRGFFNKLTRENYNRERLSEHFYTSIFHD